MRKLFHFVQLRLDLLEVRQLTGVVVAFGVLDYAGAVDNEGGTFWDAAHTEIHLWQERVVHHVVSFGDVVFVIAQKRDGDVFFFP